MSVSPERGELGLWRYPIAVEQSLQAPALSRDSRQSKGALAARVLQKSDQNEHCNYDAGHQSQLRIIAPASVVHGISYRHAVGGTSRKWCLRINQPTDLRIEATLYHYV